DPEDPFDTGPGILAAARHEHLVGVRILPGREDLFTNNLNHERENPVEHSRGHAAEKPENKPGAVRLHVSPELQIRPPALPQQFKEGHSLFLGHQGLHLYHFPGRSNLKCAPLGKDFKVLWAKAAYLSVHYDVA